MITSDLSQTVLLPGAPQIPGLLFRHYHGESDLPAMLATINAAKVMDYDERHETLEDITNNYRHLTNCDPAQDVLIAEVDGQIVAYSRVTWREEAQNNSRLYVSFGFVHPDWRRKGLGRAMLQHNERRLREIAAGHSGTTRRELEVFSTNFQAGYNALIEQEGYHPVRTFYAMVRPDLENIPDIPLPGGLEMRPACPEQYRQIWDAFQEAFQDLWGYVQPTEAEYEEYLTNSEFQPKLWQVAWDGDQVAGMILNFINHGENEEYHRKRGYTEGIAVRRPWRRRGLARALLARSLKLHRDLGMQEAALGVDSESPSGANLLYNSMGFQTVRTSTTYRKPMDL